MRNRVGFIIATIALVLALGVVVLGAYTRLADAGLGCPDWPGCYGRLVVPESHESVNQAEKAYPEQPVEAPKAWKEMIHRYAAGTLGSLIVIIWVMAVVQRLRRQPFPLGLCSRLLILLAFQAALGMWTVTWKLLPIVVMGHLVIGLTILSLLRYLQLELAWGYTPHNHKLLEHSRYSHGSLVIIGLLLVAFQIILGGWVSSNYAGLACIGFPQCNGIYLPPLDWQHAFHLSPIGENYQGGNLDSMARVTIQMAHRWNAIITAVYIAVLGVVTYRKETYRPLKISAGIAVLLIGVQFALGIILVTHLMPLPIAVLHNAIAALLMLTMVSWIFYYYHEKTKI